MTNEIRHILDLFSSLSVSDKVVCFQEMKKEFDLSALDRQALLSSFYEDINYMHMSYSYKPVFVKAFFECCDTEGNAHMSRIIEYFRDYYNLRRAKSLPVEKKGSVFLKPYVDSDEIKHCILFNPLGRTKLLKYFMYSADSEIVSLLPAIWNTLDAISQKKIISLCDIHLVDYYDSISL